MKKPSKKYWEDRAAGRMVSYTAKAESTADTLGKAYYAVARYLQGEAKDVFNAFTDKFELSVAEAETMLKNAPDKSMFEQMKTALATCTDEQKKQELETLLSSPAYAHRIGRLNELDSKISDMCSRLANAEIGVDTEHLSDIVQSAYMQTVFDVTKGADYRAAFDLIPESRVKAILSTNWSGQMFSERVWDNTDALADGLKHDMLVGIMAGKSEQHMADDIMNRCGVGAFEARRLVRTETTCVANMAELDGYRELDIDEYEFSACLDNRTSDLCRELDGKVFKRNSAQAGVNLPPMHPFCRSTTLPVLPSEEDLDKELAELGDEIGADVDFDEWERNLQQGEDGKWRYVAGSADTVKADKPMRFAGYGVDKSKENGIIRHRVLNSISDPMVEVFGAGEISNPKEITAYREELKELGVELIERDEETLAYSPALRSGFPGTIYVSKGASYSAWSHEMQHVRDDYADGWSGMKILENPEKRYMREVKAYNIEIEMAKKAGRQDIVKRLEDNLKEERDRIYGK